eukprot:8047974-Alexandrium_andersonii.AAC.1
MFGRPSNPAASAVTVWGQSASRGIPIHQLVHVLTIVPGLGESKFNGLLLVHIYLNMKALLAPLILCGRPIWRILNCM